MFTSYAVVIEQFAERHYISKFKKKYKNAWDRTRVALTEQYKRIESLIGTSNIVEIIVDSHNYKICKTEFRIAGPGKSRHASGNRCIILVDTSMFVVHVLLVYSKGDIRGPSETVGWKTLIKEAYPEYRHLL